MTTARQSSFCEHHACICVEVIADGWAKDTTGHNVTVDNSNAGTGVVTVRNATHPAAGQATFTPEEWRVFIAGVKNGEFDLPPA